MTIEMLENEPDPDSALKYISRSEHDPVQEISEDLYREIGLTRPTANSATE